MLTDIHGIDPAQFRPNLGEQPSRDGKKRREHSAEVEERTSESETGGDGPELHHDAPVEHLDIRA